MTRERHARVRLFVRTLLVAAGSALLFAGAGLAFNSLRPEGLPLVAPFSYAHDCPDELDPDAPLIDAKTALRIANRGDRGALLIDARPPELFDRGHAPAARSLPYSFLDPLDAPRAKKLAGHRHLFVYCDSPGDRMARLLADQMREAGLRGVKVVEGGWAALCRSLPRPPPDGCPEARPDPSHASPAGQRRDDPRPHRPPEERPR